MSEIDNSSHAFPVPNDARLTEQEGMTIRQYAAIKPQVPDSGVDWLDAMITKSNRDRLAGLALQGALSNVNVASAIARIGGDFAFNTARYAYENADAMLKAREVKP